MAVWFPYGLLQAENPNLLNLCFNSPPGDVLQPCPSSWPSSGLTPTGPWLFYIGGPRAGHSAPGGVSWEQKRGGEAVPRCSNWETGAFPLLYLSRCKPTMQPTHLLLPSGLYLVLQKAVKWDLPAISLFLLPMPVRPVPRKHHCLLSDWQVFCFFIFFLSLPLFHKK